MNVVFLSILISPPVANLTCPDRPGPIEKRKAAVRCGFYFFYNLSFSISRGVRNGAATQRILHTPTITPRDLHENYAASLHRRDRCEKHIASLPQRSPQKIHRATAPLRSPREIRRAAAPPRSLRDIAYLPQRTPQERRRAAAPPRPL
jgi:hypothetical protein